MSLSRHEQKEITDHLNDLFSLLQGRKTILSRAHIMEIVNRFDQIDPHVIIEQMLDKEMELLCHVEDND